MSSKKTERVYELCVHFVPTLSDEEVTQAYEALRTRIESAEAVILESVTPERFSLAFPVRHTVRQRDGTYQQFDESYFGSVKFRSPTAFSTLLGVELRKQENILRFLITETVEETTRIGAVLPDQQPSPDEGSEEGFAVEGSVIEETAEAGRS